jgi:hypothetical protein
MDLVGPPVPAVLLHLVARLPLAVQGGPMVQSFPMDRRGPVGQVVPPDRIGSSSAAARWLGSGDGPCR